MAYRLFIAAMVIMYTEIFGFGVYASFELIS